jgi:hypothetical protein
MDQPILAQVMFVLHLATANLSVPVVVLVINNKENDKLSKYGELT